MNKRGIELAINMLVILILGIAILGLGIWLATNIGKGGSNAIEVTSKMKDDLLSEQRCAASLQSNGLCIYPKSQTVSPGKTAAYLLWVSNIFRKNITLIEITNTSKCDDLKGFYKKDNKFIINHKIIRPGEDAKFYLAFAYSKEGVCSFKVDVKDNDNNIVVSDTFFLRTKVNS